jgi:hypothetical protein
MGLGSFGNLTVAEHEGAALAPVSGAHFVGELKCVQRGTFFGGRGGK